MDPRQSLDEWDKFVRSASRDHANEEKVRAMLKDPQVSSFTIIQEANIGGEYHRFLWSEGDTWWQYTGRWEKSPLAHWQQVFTDLLTDAVYVYEGVRFRAKRVNEGGYHVTFYRC